MAPHSNEKDMEMSHRTDLKDAKCYSYEEALDLSGHGKYNYGLLFACFMVIVAMGIDIFGLGIIVTAASCDLGLNLQQIGVLSSMPFAGIIVMSYPWGYLSDTKGRRLVLLWAMGGSFVSAVLSSLAPSWQVLAALRFISSALSSAAESATYALLGECCNSRSRAKYMLLMTSALMLTPTLYYVWGYFITKLNFTFYIIGIAYRPWRLLTLVMALPLGIGALLLCFFKESPKFLANVGRKEEALAVLKRMYEVNGGKGEYPVTDILGEDCKEEVGQLTLRSLWIQIAPLFKPPLLGRTLLLYYLTFVTYIANNSFAIILPTIFNVFFTSYASSRAGVGFCEIFASNANSTTHQEEGECSGQIEDNTIWAGCAHGLSFFVLNALISQCAGKRKALTITILLIAAIAAIVIDLTGEALSGLVLFYVYLTTAMVFGVISSYFVTLYPTSYRGMVACLGMMVARLSAFTGTNVVSGAITDNCAATFYGAAGLVISGAIAAWFLPPDGKEVD
ncbi:synaptic vesicle 2-related protein-like isoform X1 [Maniola jurtina]|uniref:synaptic vesicle 2-related protein-like isoform X1 n=2 Tax=Maniola jurtina TaxID=191418 RepID=UPI001E68D064|nr:synaptic vesicle 2-related protein-like isoform X1 [Maniola jurtina]XP_045767219.1 synaptic vesicle 2-related protein-like isoform X1 [Maniola jurtina]XP_045767220.1 synaptic vesicle 2-related protein-like isoform X1 [Maniola jurtina]